MSAMHLCRCAAVAVVGLLELLAASACAREPRSQPTPVDERSLNAPGFDASSGDASARDEDASGDEPARARSSLVQSTRWRVAAALEDPFADRPSDVVCPESGYMPELLADEAAFSVDTGVCSYLTVHQPALRDVLAGETIVVRVWHFMLTAPAPAMAHVAVHLGDEVLMDSSVAIPAAGGLLRVATTARDAIPAGTEVYFHVHNHGTNSWSVVEVSAGP